MASPLADHHQVRPAATGLALPFGPHYPRIIQAWLWLKRPLWFLDHCTSAYGDVFAMRLPLGMNLVHIAGPERDRVSAAVRRARCRTGVACLRRRRASTRKGRS